MAGIDFFLANFTAIPQEGKKPLQVQFRDPPPYDVIVEVDEGFEYIIVEVDENFDYIIAE